MHAFKLIGMLLDAHINLKTIDIVPLLYSPKMVRLSLPSSRLAAAHLHATHRVVHAFLPQLLDNVKEAKEILAANLASSGPSVESLGGFEARAYRFFSCHPLCGWQLTEWHAVLHMLCCTCCPRAAVDLRVYAPRAQKLTEEQDTKAEKPKPHFCSAKSTVPPSSVKAILLIYPLACSTYWGQCESEQNRVYSA